MAFTFLGRTIEEVGVVGSGQIGPDIALYFSKVLSPFGCRVVVVDIDEAALQRGRGRLDKKVDRGIQSGAFTPEQGETMKQAVSFTTDYAALGRAGLVVEAATEDAAVKERIFRTLEEQCPEGAILASNSSHLEPEVIAGGLTHRGRSAVIHYFFPAERNPVVEVVPGGDTDPGIADWLMRFYERIGKAPIRVRSRYGYAIDPIFEGLFLAAALCVEQGLGTTKEVDAVATRCLGQRVGPFTAMNLTGGNPITAKGLDNYHEKIMPWFRTPELLRRQVESGKPWEVPQRGEKVELEPGREEAITKELQGAYFGICDEILTAGITDLTDMEMAVELALDMTPPAALANKVGLDKARLLAMEYARGHEGFREPEWLAHASVGTDRIEVPVIMREDRRSVAVVRIRRPKVLNALNEEAFAQLRRVFEEVEADGSVRAAVLTGFGIKAFISGADVNFLSRIDSPETGMEGSRRAQELTLLMERMSKPLVCALNGVAFGGGLELAMACRARVARKGLKVLGGQPEVNLGIIPAAGGTQRLPRLVGLERAAGLLRTGRTFSSKEAGEMGLVSQLVDAEVLVDRAVDLALDLAAGRSEAPPLPTGPLQEVPDSLPALDLGHLSRKIDEILVQAILEGARTTLEEGLQIENRLFGEVCRTQDMRIGVRTFLEEGPRAQARFVHA